MVPVHQLWPRNSLVSNQCVLQYLQHNGDKIPVRDVSKLQEVVHGEQMGFLSGSNTV